MSGWPSAVRLLLSDLGFGILVAAAATYLEFYLFGLRFKKRYIPSKWCSMVASSIVSGARKQINAVSSLLSPPYSVWEQSRG